MFLAGILTSSKKTTAVSEHLIPILSIFLARWMPGVSMGRQIRDLFLWADK